MGLIFKARGNASITPLLIRITIGILFLVAGATKIVDIQGFIVHLQSLNVMPENIAFIVGFITPFAEIILGGLYVLGFFTPVVSLFLSIMIVGILATTGVSDPVLPFSYNFIFLACTISTIFSGAGVISFDALLDRKKKSATHNENVNIVRTVPPTSTDEVVTVREEVDIELIEPEDKKQEPKNLSND